MLFFINFDITVLHATWLLKQIDLTFILQDCQTTRHMAVAFDKQIGRPRLNHFLLIFSGRKFMVLRMMNSSKMMKMLKKLRILMIKKMVIILKREIMRRMSLRRLTSRKTRPSWKPSDFRPRNSKTF